MYLFLTVCTMLSFFVFQSKVKNNISNKRYFILALLPIALYCLTYGFRKGWGKDYEVYSNLFEGNSYIRIDSYEPLFRVVVVLLRQLSESSTLLLVVVAAMTIFSYVYILKEHKSVLGLGLSLFYLFSAYQASNLIRFFMALSIAYIGIDLALQRKWVVSIITLFSSFLIHAGISIFIIMVFPFLKFKIFLNLKYNIIFYLISALLSVGSLQTLFGDLIFKGLTALDFGGLQLAKYADQDVINSYILGTTWGKIDKSAFYLVFNCLYGLLFIVFGHKLINKMPHIKNIEFYYQIGVLGVIFGNIAVNTEILYRIAISFTYLSSLVYAYIIKCNKKIGINPVLFMLFFVSVAYMCFFSVKQIYSGFNVLYIWN